MAIHSASDHGYQPAPARCIACGSHELDCCDGHGKRLSFDAWGAAVDRRICAITGVERNEITAPYSEFYLIGLGVEEAVTRALDCGHVEQMA